MNTNTMKDKTTTSHWCFQIILTSINPNTFSITLSALSLIVISMLSFFECITYSSSLSLEEKKEVTIVKWVLHVSAFLRLFMRLLSTA